MNLVPVGALLLVATRVGYFSPVGQVLFAGSHRSTSRRSEDTVHIEPRGRVPHRLKSQSRRLVSHRTADSSVGPREFPVSPPTVVSDSSGTFGVQDRKDELLLAGGHLDSPIPPLVVPDVRIGR
ncbi:unnamed protein product [Boreogadus saida]